MHTKSQQKTHSDDCIQDQEQKHHLQEPKAENKIEDKESKLRFKHCHQRPTPLS